MAKLRRLFLKVYPWANTTFEVWLLVCNVAYLFDKTPYYRPWLRWIGVDVRRLGADDMVRIFAGRACDNTDVRLARSATSIARTDAYHEAVARPLGEVAEALAVFSSAASRQPEGPAPHGDLLHPVPGVVVFAKLACPFPRRVTTGASRASSASASPSSTGSAPRWDEVRRVRAVPRSDRECDCVPIWICVLLQVCIRVRARARAVSCNVGTCTDVAAAKDIGVKTNICQCMSEPSARATRWAAARGRSGCTFVRSDWWISASRKDNLATRGKRSSFDS